MVRTLGSGARYRVAFLTGCVKAEQGRVDWNRAEHTRVLDWLVLRLPILSRLREIRELRDFVPTNRLWSISIR